MNRRLFTKVIATALCVALLFSLTPSAYHLAYAESKAAQVQMFHERTLVLIDENYLAQDEIVAGFAWYTAWSCSKDAGLQLDREEYVTREWRSPAQLKLTAVGTLTKVNKYEADLHYVGVGSWAEWSTGYALLEITARVAFGAPKTVVNILLPQHLKKGKLTLPGTRVRGFGPLAKQIGGIIQSALGIDIPVDQRTAYADMLYHVKCSPETGNVYIWPADENILDSWGELYWGELESVVR